MFGINSQNTVTDKTIHGAADLFIGNNTLSTIPSANSVSYSNEDILKMSQ